MNLHIFLMLRYNIIQKNILRNKNEINEKFIEPKFTLSPTKKY